MLSVPSIIILVSMIVIGILLAAALYHIYQEPAKPEGGHEAISGKLERRPLMRPRG